MPTEPTLPDYLSVAEAASALSVSTKTVRRLIARGDLPAKRIGSRMIRIAIAALDGLGRDMQVPRSR